MVSTATCSSSDSKRLWWCSETELEQRSPPDLTSKGSSDKHPTRIGHHDDANSLEAVAPLQHVLVPRADGCREVCTTAPESAACTSAQPRPYLQCPSCSLLAPRPDSAVAQGNKGREQGEEVRRVGHLVGQCVVHEYTTAGTRGANQNQFLRSARNDTSAPAMRSLALLHGAHLSSLSLVPPFPG